MPGQPYRYKLFDLYTQKYILTDPQNPQSVLTEDVENSLLEFILPESAKERLSVATIEMGMDGGMVANNHPEPDKNVLLLAKGSRGIYGPAEYKELLQPYLDLVKDYPYQRYLTNENVSAHTKDLKIWVVDDERGISGVEGISSEIAAQILGDSHGKMSLELATAIGSPLNLMQYRMISADPANGWFAKGTLAPSLNNTLEKFALSDRSEFEGVDLIVPTSSLKGVSRQNLPPGIHTSKVHLSHHNKSRETKITLRSVLEKLDGDSFTSALKQQAVAIEELNEIFANSDSLNQEFMKSLEPVFMPNPDNPDERIDFDPDRWEQCGDWKYITFRKDYESGHQQLINSPIFAQDKEKFYASRARKAAQLSFVKANGGMIFCSSQLTNNQICVPGLPDGAKVAAIRSPIIKLQDIALVENKLIDDINNDAGIPLKGAIICSPQAYEQLLHQTRSFISQNTDKLAAAGIDTQAINRLNPFNSNDYKDVVLAEVVGEQREELTLRLNLWREGYNALINNNQSELPHLEQIRQDSFTAIIKGDFDGDNIAILPQQQYPAIYAGIEARINGSDSYTAKLDKIEVTGEQELSWLLADKADPYILGKTANLAENLQSLAVAAGRVQRSGTIEQQLDHIKQIAPSFYYMMANPTAAEIKAAEAANLPSTFRYYNISSTGERLIDEALVQQFDAYGLDKALLQVYGGGEVEPIIARRLFDTWKGLLLNLTDAVAQQNQIAVDTFKSERPIDRDLVEGIAGRFRILDDGLKKALSDNETYLSQVPQVKDSVTNRSLLVQNVNQNLVAYQAPFASYKQIQGLFPNVEDEFINQEVASLSNEYDKLTSLSSTIRQKSRIDRGPSMIFNDGSGRSFEVTNIMTCDRSVASLSKEFTQGNVKIKFEPNTKADSPHQLVALYSVGQDWQSLGTVCNACVKRLDLDLLAELELDNISDIDFTSSSAVHLADSYSQRAYRLAWEFRARISDEQVNDYAAATYNYLTNSTSQSNRLGLMFQIFGSELATQVESMQLQEIKVGSLTGSEIANSMQIQTAVNEAGQPVVMRVNEVGELTAKGGERLTELGIISPDSFQLRPGARAMVQAEYLAPSVADITLPDGEQLTVGGMSKFETAGTVFRDEELELETAMGSPSKTPVIKIDGEIVGNLKQESVAYLEDNQLLVEGQALDLTLTTVGKGYYQKIKAVATNGKTLELTNLSKSFQQPVLDKQVSAQVSFKTNRPQMQLYAYRQGKRVAIGEFNYGNQGSHRKSLDQLKAMGLDRQIFKAKVNSRLSVLTLKIEPESISYQDDPALAKLETAKIEVKEVNSTTDYFLARQQQYQNFGIIRSRDYLNDAGEIESALSLDLVVDESSAQYIADDAPRFRDISQISDGDPSIELETVKGFTVYSKPIEAMKMVEIAQLKQEFNLQEIYDLSATSDLNAAVAYQTQLKNNYPDVVEFEAQPSGSERLFLPSIYSQAGGKGLMTTVSSKLLEVINLTPTESQVNQIKLDRFDYLWLQQNLKLDPGLSDQQTLQAAFRSENHIQLKQLTSGIITAEGELVYQHVQAATDARFGEELKSVLGQPNYEFHRENAKRLIDSGITPVVVYADGNTSIASKLLVNRPEVTIPLPEKLDKNIAPPIVIGGADKFGLSLNNPHDYQNPDLEHPVSYEGINYPSVQHAYSEIVNRDNIPQSKTYELVKELMFAKLSQHPQIVDGIRSRGGYKWLYTCSHQLEGNEFWTGQGKNTPLVGIIAAGMKQTQLTETKSQDNFSKKIITLKSDRKKQISTLGVEVQPTDRLVNNKEAKSNPLANIQPKNAAVASHMVKDLAMADVATQFIGMPVNFDGKSSTEKYLQAWGDRANTGSYTANDVVMISGNGPWRTTPERLAEVFDNQYRPLINKAIAAKAKIVVGSAKGTDLLVQRYLESQGYKLADSGRNYVEATSVERSRASYSVSSTRVPRAMRSESFRATLPRAASIQFPALNIVGKKVSMSYPLMLEGRSNPLSVNTCFDAMRGHGRVHTTRNFEPYKAWGFKEGDLAIAYDHKTNREILFRVGKQQRITNQMIADPNYQAQWAEVEKHAPEVLPKLFASKVAAGNEVWGMTYEPLGDFVNGKIYDFEDGKEIVLSDLGKDKTVIPLPEAINLTAESRAKLSSPPIVGMQSQAMPVVKPAPVAKSNIVAMINVPNLDGVNSAQLKSQVSETLINSNTSAKLLDTIKVWRNQLGEINNVNSLIANFADSPDLDTLKYRAALVGQSTSQKAVVAFREDINGSDALYSVNVPNHVDEYALRAKLSELEITQFSIIPTPKFNKVIISDRQDEKLSVASEMAKHYGSKLTITQGQSIFIRGREYAQTIGDFAAQNSAISRRGDRDRPDQSRGKSQSNHLGGDGGGIKLKPPILQQSLVKSIAPKITSSSRIQDALTLEAVPILREILNNSPGKRKFTDGEIVIAYQGETKSLSVVDIASSQLKMQAVYDGQKWQSDPKCLGGMRREDLDFLRAALVMVTARNREQISSETIKPIKTDRSLFAGLASKDSLMAQSKTQPSSAVER